MTLEQILLAILPILAGYVAYNERQISMLKNKISKLLDKKDINDMIDNKLVGTHVELSNIKDDIKDIKSTTDKVLDILLSRSDRS